MAKRIFGNSNAEEAHLNTPDIKTFGDSNTFKVICKASSDSQQWMKSTKAMEIEGLGCIVQVSTQQGNQVAEAATFVFGAKIQEETDNNGNVIGRKLISSLEDHYKRFNEIAIQAQLEANEAILEKLNKQ